MISWVTYDERDGTPIFFRSRDGSSYRLTKKRYWARVGFDEGFSTDHALEFAATIKSDMEARLTTVAV